MKGLTPPFMLTAVDASGTQLSAMAMAAGSTNIDALTTAASFVSGDSLESGDHSAGYSSVLGKLRTVLAPLFDHYNIKWGEDVTESRAYRTMLKEVSFTISSGTITVTNRATGGVIFSAPLNNLASGVLHPENIPGGTVVTPPPPPPPSACSYTYSAWAACQSNGTQTRTVISSIPAGCTGTPVLSQACVYTPPPPACTYTTGAWGACQADGTQTRTVSASPVGCAGTPPASSQACTYVPPVVTCTSFNYSAWGTCSASGTQTRTVTSATPAGCTGGSPVLSQSCTPPAVTCTSFTYSAWAPAVCPSSGQQTRTVATSSPAGCTGGTPVVSQACTYVPDGAALYAAKCAGCHGPLATSAKAGRTAAQITAANMTQGLTAAEVQAVANALATVVPACTYTTGAWGACQPDGTQTRTVTSSPSVCTGTPPASSQACTYVPPVVTCTSFNYSAWGTCSAAGTQTRTVTSSLPAGCTGGSPVLSQSCTPPPVACTSFTYNAWTPAVCPSSGQQTRTVATSSPAGCTGGTPVVSQACTYVPDGAALYAAKCAGCHGPLATSAKAGRTAAQITAANMTQGLTAAEVQAVANALATVVPACTYTTGAWGACQPNGTQTRTVTASPSVCTGTPPASSQSCTYVPPVVTCTSFTYSAPTPAVCPSSGQQTRTVVSSAPAGCTGGTPVLTVACTYVPDGAALYAAKCAGCHGPLATSAKAGRTAAQITAANMTQGLTAAEVQAVANALATVVPVPSASGATLYAQKCSGCHGSLGTSAKAGRTAAQITAANMTQGLNAVDVQAVANALSGSALYAAKCAGCHGPLDSSAKKGRTAAQITAANMTQGLTAAQVQDVATALAP